MYLSHWNQCLKPQKPEDIALQPYFDQNLKNLAKQIYTLKVV